MTTSARSPSQTHRIVSTNDDNGARVPAEILRRARPSLGASDFRVRNVDFSPSPYATRSSAFVVTVNLDDTSDIRLFMKRADPEGEEHPDKPGSHYEPRIYERLLADEGLPVPRYCGTTWERFGHAREVYLEYVDAWNLEYHDLGSWYRSAERLADLHVRLATRIRLAGVPSFLRRFDKAYFLRRARLARESVAMTSPGLSSRLRALVERYEPTARLLSQQRPTLVHNDLAPKNVLIDRSFTPPRVCIVDWEMAGAGCGVLDLTHLKYGLEPDADAQMSGTYHEAARGTGLVPDDRRDWHRLLGACETHEAMTRLWRNRFWDKPIDVVTGWIEEAEAGVRASG